MSDLAELFARDPLLLTDADIDAIITRMRQARAQWNAGVKAAGATKKVTAADPAAADLLKDLGL